MSYVTTSQISFNPAYSNPAYQIYKDNEIKDLDVKIDNSCIENNKLSKIIFKGEEYDINSGIEETEKLQRETDDLRGKIFEHRYELENQITEIMKRLNRTVSLVHNCANCGAQLNIEENKPVFHCKYCGSTYLIGTAQIYSNY